METLLAWSAALLVIGVHPRVLALIANLLLRFILLQSYDCGRRRGVRDAGNVATRAATAVDVVAIPSAKIQHVSLWGLALGGIVIQTTDGLIIRIRKISLRLRQGLAKAESKSCVKKSGVKMPMVVIAVDGVRISVSNPHGRLTPHISSSECAEEIANTADEQHVHGTNEHRYLINGLSLPRLAVWSAHLVALEVNNLRVDEVTGSICARQKGSILGGDALAIDAQRDPSENARAKIRTMCLNGVRVQGSYSRRVSCMSVSVLIKEVRVTDFTGDDTKRYEAGGSSPNVIQIPECSTARGRACITLDTVNIALITIFSHPIRKRSLQLQATESLNVTLSRVDAAVDVSWLEHARAISRRREDFRVQTQISFLHHLQRKAESNMANKAHAHKEVATEPSTEHDEKVGTTEKVGCLPLPYRAQRSATPPRGSLFDSRFIPARAMLALGTFSATCVDDVGKADPLGSGCDPYSLNKLEICGRGCGVLGLASTNARSDTADAGGDVHTGGNLRNSFTFLWAITTGGGSSSLSSKIKVAMARITTTNASGSIGEVLTGAQASAFLGEVNFSCCSKGHVDDAKATGAVGSKRRSVTKPAQVPGLIISGISFVPTFDVQLLSSIAHKCPENVLPVSSLSTEGTESAVITTDNIAWGCVPSERSRVSTPRSTSPPPLPPRPRDYFSDPKFFLKVPEVKFQMEAVQGRVGVDMAAWFNLRGVWETQDLTAATQRAENLFAAECAPSETSRASEPRLCGTIATVRVTVEDMLPAVGETRRCSALFEIEADDMRVQKDHAFDGKKRIPASCNRMFQAEKSRSLVDDTVRDTAVSVECCRASVALVDDVSVAFSNSENSKDCQLILGARGIRATKVTEKGSLGTTTRAAMEISCEQVSGEESIGNAYRASVATLKNLSFAQLSFADSCVREEKFDVEGNANEKPKHNEKETPLMTEEVTLGDSAIASTASKTLKHTRLLAPAAARGGGVKVQEMKVEETDIAWSGSSHCWFILLSKRFAHTVNYLLGLPPATLPRKFTKRVLLQRAYIHCALGQVHEGGRGESRLSLGSHAKENKDPKGPPPWCGHRMDVRLRNFEACHETKKLTVSTDDEEQREAQDIHGPGIQTQLTVASSLLEILIPSSFPAPAQAQRPLSTQFYCCHNRMNRTGDGTVAPSVRGRRRHTSPGRFATVTADKVMGATTQAVGGIREEFEETHPVKSEPGKEGEEQTPNSRTGKPGHEYCGLETTKIVAIESFKYRRSLKSSPQEKQSFSPDARRGNDGGDDESLALGNARESPSNIPGWSSHMNVSFRAEGAVITIPPRFQLGDLLTAVQMQRKGIEAVLGGAPAFKPADSCATSIVLGSLHLRIERDSLIPPSSVPCMSHPARPSSSLTPRLHQHTTPMSFEGSECGDGPDVVPPSRATSSDGQSGGGRSGDTGVGADDTSSIPRAFLRGIKRRGASLSAFLGLGGSDSSENAGGQEEDKNYGAESRRDGTSVPAGVGGFNATVPETTGGEADDGSDCLGSPPLAVLEVDQISFEVSRKEPRQTLLASIRKLDEHPGDVTYGQAMGGWGKLSASSSALFLDSLPVPFLSVESVVWEGLFARAALIGTNTSYRQVFSRLSSFHAEHPLARAAAAADATEATGGLSFVAPSSLRRNSFDEVPDGYPLVESSIASLSTQQQLPKRRGTLLLLVKALPGGDESRLLAGRAAVRRHACFVERMDGTPSKFYVDLKGGVAGPRIVYGNCLDSSVEKIARAMGRLFPAVRALNKQPAKQQEEQQHNSSTRSQLFRIDSAREAFGFSGSTKTDPVAGNIHAATPKTPPAATAAATPQFVGLWDRLRYLVHGRVSFTTEEVELTALLGSSPALVEASVRLLVADAKVAYYLGHVDLRIQRMLVTTPARPVATVLESGYIETGNNTAASNSAQKQTGASGKVKLGAINPHTSAQHHRFPSYLPSWHEEYRKTHSISTEAIGGSTVDAGSHRAQLKLKENMFGPRHSVAFLAETALSIDFSWTCKNGANPNLHHLETVPAGSRGGRGNDDAWVSYSATGLKLRVTTEISRHVPTVVADVTAARHGGIDSSTGEERKLRAATRKQGGGEQGGTRRYRRNGSEGLGDRWVLGRESSVDAGVGVNRGRGEGGGESTKGDESLVGELFTKARSTRAGTSINVGTCGEAHDGEKVNRFTEEDTFKLSYTNGNVASDCRGADGVRSTDNDASKASHLIAAKVQDYLLAEERSSGPTTVDPSLGCRTMGTSPCLPHPPACNAGSATEGFVAKDDQREESIRLFGQGLWVAIRLDLLSWFKTLLSAPTSTGSHSSADQSTVNDAGSKFAWTATTVGGEDHSGGKERTSLRTNQETVFRKLGSGPGSRRVSLKSLVTGVEVSATVSGFGLATWRSAENRDGIVFNINRTRISLCVGEKFASVTGGADGMTSVDRKSMNVSLESVRLFRLHFARDASLAFGGGETLPDSPPTGWCRKSRPRVFGRPPAGNVNNIPWSPPAPKPVEKTQERQDENTDLIVSLDRSLSAASDKIAFLRARKLTFQRRDAVVDSDVKSRSERLVPSPPIPNDGREERSTGHTQVPAENLARVTATASTSAAEGVLICASSSSHNEQSPPMTMSLCDETRTEGAGSGEAGEAVSGGYTVSYDDDTDAREGGEGAANFCAESTMLPCTYVGAARSSPAKDVHSQQWRAAVAKRVASQARLAGTVDIDDRLRPEANRPQAITMISTGAPAGVSGSNVTNTMRWKPTAASVGERGPSSVKPCTPCLETPPPLPPRPRPLQPVCEGARASSEIAAAVAPEVERNVPPTTRSLPSRGSADGCTEGMGATILILVDGLHLVWTLEIRDGLFLFVADARDSFSRTPSSDDKYTSPPTAGGTDDSDRYHPHARCESDFLTDNDRLASTEHLGNVGRASEPARSPAYPVVEGREARDAETLQSTEGAAASGETVVSRVIASEDKHMSVRSSQAPSSSPSAQERSPPQSLSHTSPASSNMSFMVSLRAARRDCSTLGCRGDGSSDQRSLLDWLRIRSGQAKSILSDGTSSSGVPLPDSLSKLSPLHPCDGTSLSNAQPVKPVAKSSPRSGAVEPKKAVVNTGGRNEPRGGGNRVDYEVRFDSPQIKLVGEGSCLILYADRADAEAKTYSTCLAVASTPGSPRASLFHKEYYSLLRRKEVKVQLKGARVFAAAENDGDRDRWVKIPTRQSVPTPVNSPSRSSGTSASGVTTIPTSAAPSGHDFDSPLKSFGSSGKSEENQGEASDAPALPLTSPATRPPYPSGVPVREDGEEEGSSVKIRTRRRRFGRSNGGSDSGGGDRSGGGRSPSTGSLAIELKEVMEPFSVHTLYVYHEVLPACETEARLHRALEISRRDPEGTSETFGVRRCPRPPSSKLRLDVPELNANLDSRQFFEVLDVVKNLLLAPPPTELRSWVLERKRRRRVEGCIDSKEVLGQEAIRRENKGKDHDVRNKPDREHLREIVEKVLSSWACGGNASSAPPSAAPATTPPRAGGGVRPPLPAEPRELTRIEYRIGRCTWLMTLDQEVNGLKAQVEVGVTGLSSINSYLGHRGFGPTVVVQNVRMQIERLWARHVPRPDEKKQQQHQQRQKCSDSSVAPLAHRNDKSSCSILSPRLCGTQPCQACGEHFTPEHNAWDSCRVHGTDEGEVGEFIVPVGYATSRSSCTRASPEAAATLNSVGRWSCCGAGSKSNPGCVPRPHVPKEIMITVRADGAPSVLVGTTKVSCFRHFEVNIFPAVLYELDLYLRRGVAASMMRYFKIEPTKDSESALPRGPRLIASSSRRKSRSDRHGACPETPPCSRVGPAAALTGREMGGQHRSDGACIILLGKRGNGVAAASAEATAAAALPAPSGASSGGVEPPSKESSDEDTAGDTLLGQDVVYLKYVRLGEVKLNVTASGLKIMRFRNLKVSTPPYVRHEKMSEWSRLSSKIAWHLGGHVMICVFKQLHVQLGMLAGLPVGDAGGGDWAAPNPRESGRTQHSRVRSRNKTTRSGSPWPISSCSDESSTPSHASSAAPSPDSVAIDRGAAMRTSTGAGGTNSITVPHPLSGAYSENDRGGGACGALSGHHQQRGSPRSEDSAERPVQIDGGVLSDGDDEAIAASAALLLPPPPPADVLGREARRRERADRRRSRRRAAREGLVRLFRRDPSRVGRVDGGGSTESESSR